MLDVDFQPSRDMYSLLHGADNRHVWTNAHRRLAFVIPAFQFKLRCPCEHSTVYAETEEEMNVTGIQPHRCIPVPASKVALVAAVRRRWICVFHAHFEGHLYTDNRRWLNTTQPYYVNWGTFYEPYVVVNKSLPDFPEYDARFLDRGMNKVIFTAQLHSRHFQFVVLPSFFLTHVFETKISEKTTRRRHNMLLRSELYSEVMGEERQRHTLLYAHSSTFLHEYLPHTPLLRTYHHMS
jgi:hypothetical protein